MEWPFATRGLRKTTVAPTEPLTPDFQPQAFAWNDSKITVWLSTALDGAVSDLSIRHGASRPDILRVLLFEHVYGRLAHAQLVEWKRRHDRPSPDTGIRASNRRDGIEVIGKSTKDFRLELPTKLRDDLQSLAAESDMGISDYCRKVLVQQLLGEAVLRKYRPRAEPVPAHYREIENQ